MPGTRARNKEKLYEIQPSAESEGFFIPKIVITGGPASGKTTALTYLRQTLPGILTVNEAATQVLQGGFPLPNETRPWSEEWQRGLQNAIAGQQLGLECVAEEDAKTERARAIVFDRALADGAGYLQGGTKELETILRRPIEEVYQRYTAVIYLGWLAGQYETESNPARYEDEERAQLLSGRIKQAWQAHPNFIEVTTNTNRAEAVHKLVRQILSTTAQ